MGNFREFFHLMVTWLLLPVMTAQRAYWDSHTGPNLHPPRSRFEVLSAAFHLTEAVLSTAVTMVRALVELEHWFRIAHPEGPLGISTHCYLFKRR